MKKFLLTAIVMAATTAAHANIVSYYGPGFHGKKTANGERFNQNAMTCASNTHRFGTLLQVTNTANGKSVVCRVNDRGGFTKYGVTLDLSRGAFAQIAPLSQGRARVSITAVNADSITDSPVGNSSLAMTHLPALVAQVETNVNTVIRLAALTE